MPVLVASTWAILSSCVPVFLSTPTNVGAQLLGWTCYSKIASENTLRLVGIGHSGTRSIGANCGPSFTRFFSLIKITIRDKTRRRPQKNQIEILGDLDFAYTRL